MARQEFKVQANNFTGGLITEASPLSFPENSCLDIQNMDINIDGSVSRRHALRPEPDTEGIVSSFTWDNYFLQPSIYVWKEAGGIPNNHLVCVQDGNTLRFYRESDSLGSDYIEAAINLAAYRTQVLSIPPPISMTNIRGALIVTARNIAPIAITYVDTTHPSFTVVELNLVQRDLDGLPTTLAVNERPIDMHGTNHEYNLLNQGWDLDKITAFFTEHAVYPSNADIWHAGRDADNEFDPEELIKIDFGTSQAPRGRNIHNVFSGPEYSTNQRPAVVATYAGRAFYAGIPFFRIANQIFFSQILSDPSTDTHKCMSAADPTSEIDPDIVATDGGVITINNLGEVLAMREQQQSLIVFTTNGVWEISGEGDNFFSALGYSVRKITSVPVVSARSIVDVEGSLMFMGEDGIYFLQPNEITFQLQAINITAANIKTYYLMHVMPCSSFSCGVYDYKRRQVIWLYGTQLPACPKCKLFTNALVFNIDTQSFSKYKFSFTVFEPDFTTPRIFGAVALRNISADVPVIRFLTKYEGDPGGGHGGGFSALGWYQLDTPKEEGFVDTTFNDDGVEVPSFVITGNATLDDVGTRKTARQIILHMLRTETGIVDGNFIHPSSAKVRIAWDFTNDSASNKWMPEFQGYRYRQLYLPETPTGTFDTGYQVITTKTKLRGTGRAFSMQFRSTPDHDMNILGWSITGSAEANE